ncbi:hypothetical protein BKP37_12780 [Anaerobacillus alkalilacustris]|uniref:Tyr recombinase domain-containing protein n=1 Tax=Anaerobacillus alkalilacustris TaxID=393763 RepID=A0A1S2LJS4_9BACI|nr:tyrosine-type recombinase/integrase [Anaerobacillus alkalilacustris]OIJ12671.1 hypothetical protein BKP37_12780 [Anaerobacillus alkalilacustris]
MNFVQPIRDPDVIEGIKQYLRLRSMRDYLFFCFGIYSGLRVSDLRMLRVGMVRNKKHIKLIEQKNKKPKKFIIHPKIQGDLEKFISGKRDDEFLFASRQIKTKSKLRGQPIDRSTAYKMLNKAAREFGLDEIGCHTLRKTWGYHIYMQNPHNLALLMEMFGHSNLHITLRYIGVTQDMADAATIRL